MESDHVQVIISGAWPRNGSFPSHFQSLSICWGRWQEIQSLVWAADDNISPCRGVFPRPDLRRLTSPPKCRLLLTWRHASRGRRRGLLCGTHHVWRWDSRGQCTVKAAGRGQGDSEVGWSNKRDLATLNADASSPAIVGKDRRAMISDTLSAVS